MNEQYDKDILSDDLVLLNDKLVTERLSDDIASEFGVPTVPSQALLKRVHAQLAESDAGIRKYAESVSSYADSISDTAETSAKAAFDLIRSSGNDISQISANAANYDKLTFTYKKDDKAIWLKLQNLKGDNGKALSIDASDFIKDGMVDNAAFVTSRPDPEHPGETLYGRWICIIFNTAAGKDPVYVDIDKLVPIVGEGLLSTSDISGQAMINVDWNMVARAEAITKTVKFVGNILVQEESELTTYLRNQEWTTEDRLENGSWIAVSSLTETKDMTLNGARRVIENGDYLVIHDSDISVKRVLISELEFGKNLFVVRSNVTYAQLSSISSDLDQRLVAEISRATDAENTLQKNIDTEIERATNAETELEKKFNEKLANETARAVSVEDYLSNEVSSEVVRAQTVEGGLSAEISSCSVSCDKLCAIIATEVAARTDIDNELSDAIRQKVFISSYLSDDAVSGYSDLSVIKLPKDEYDRIVANPTPLCGNTLYVVDSDYIDAYGQQIKNVSMNEHSFDADDSYLGIAATDMYVNKKCQDLNGILSNMISSETDDRISADKELSDDYNAKIVAEVARAFDTEGRISSEVSSIPRVKVLSSYDIETLSGVEYADALSVVNVTNDEYDKLVVDEKICDTMLYVIKDDYLDARGQCLKNLADPVELSDAVNKAYADGRVNGIKSTLNSLAYELSAKISVPTDTLTLNDIIMTIIEKLSAI